MRIVTYDGNGNKEIINYSKETVATKEPEFGFDITSYPQFRLCIKRMQEEKEYANGKGDRRYEKALQRLITERHDLYEKFNSMLNEEYRNSR